MRSPATPSRVLVTAGAGTLVVGTFLPWLASGANERNSYDLVALVDRLGFSTSGPFDLAVRGWSLVPLLAAVATVASWWGRRVIGAVVAALAAVYAGSVALAVLLAPQVGLMRILAGVPVTLTGAAVLLAGAVATAWAPSVRVPAVQGG